MSKAGSCFQSPPQESKHGPRQLAGLRAEDRSGDFRWKIVASLKTISGLAIRITL